MIGLFQLQQILMVLVLMMMMIIRRNEILIFNTSRELNAYK
jgi:hypothetical protein